MRDGIYTEPKQLTEFDIHLFNEGRAFRIYRKMGAQWDYARGQQGFRFSVWAPNAENVSVIGDFNSWNPERNPLEPIGNSGIWSGFIPGVPPGQAYKYLIRSGARSYQVEKSDPFAFRTELPPKTASLTWQSEYLWKDQEWMRTRGERVIQDRPMSIYEMHLGSWRRNPDGNRLGYRELAEVLPGYLNECGFTHVEFLPVMEHPFYGSWGYQTTAYFAPTARYGSPDDFKHLVDRLHQAGIGVILDWVPSHFPGDEFALSYFDGTHLFEHSDPRQGYHPDWNSLIFNYGRNEVRSFLISSALYWLDEFHADGIRVDAVASMLYLDYSRKEGEWIPNPYGGRENIDAIRFLRELNETIYAEYPDVHTIAEESTAWPMVSRPTYIGGLGFGMKWDMGWMHDTIEYFKKDPVYRKYHHDQLTFRMIYAFNENFVLSLSHDEVVYGKGALVEKMAGDDWQKFANNRSLFAYMFAQPGKKLLFMGMEMGQRREWDHESQLDWGSLESPIHQGLQRLVSDLNQLYRTKAQLHDGDFQSESFEWLDVSDYNSSVFSFFRRSKTSDVPILIILNLTPNVLRNYRLGVPLEGYWREILNTDATVYGGSGVGNFGGKESTPVAAHGHLHSLSLTLPPLGALYLEWTGENP